MINAQLPKISDDLQSGLQGPSLVTACYCAIRENGAKSISSKERDEAAIALYKLNRLLKDKVQKDA